MLMQANAKTRLASLLLGEDLETWVSTRREQQKSWLAIARELNDATKGEVTFSHEGLRMRFGGAPEDVKSSSGT